MAEKKNAFDEISQLLENQNVVSSNPMTMDIGANNFFEIDFPTNPISSEEEILPPVTIENKDVAPKEEEKEEKKEAEEQETQEQETVIEVEEKDGPDYNEWNDLALIALTKIKKGDWDLDENDIPKDLDADTLLELFEAQEKNTREKIEEDVLTKAGEYASYLKFLMDGGSPDVVRDAIEVKKVSLTDISTEEGQKEVITALLEIKGLDDDLINETLETIFDKGKGKVEAEKAQEQLRKYEDSILESKAKELEKQKEIQTQRYNEYVTNVTNIVKKGKLGTLNIDERKQAKIIDAIFKPTEIVEITNPRTGKLEKTRITKSSKLFNEVQSDPEKYASLVLWLLEGGTFEGLKEEVKEKKDDSLREILKGRKATTVVVKKPTTNAFEYLARQANNR